MKRGITNNLPAPVLLQVRLTGPAITLATHLPYRLEEGTGWRSAMDGTLFSGPVYQGNLEALTHASGPEPIHEIDKPILWSASNPSVGFRRVSRVTFDPSFVSPVFNSRDWAPMTMWYFTMKTPGADLSLPYMKLSRTMVTKESGFRTGYDSRECVLAQLYVSDPAKPMNQQDWRFTVHPDWGMSANFSTTENVPANRASFKAFGESSFPNLRFSQPTVSVPAGGAVNVPVDYDGNFPLEIFMETTGGHLPVTRQEITSPGGMIRIAAPFNLAGDSFKVKIGTKFWTGIDEVQVLVI